MRLRANERNHGWTTRFTYRVVRFGAGTGANESRFRRRMRSSVERAVVRRARCRSPHFVRPRGRSPSDAPSSIARCAPSRLHARGVDVSIDRDRRFSCVRVTGCTMRSIEGVFHRTKAPELSVFTGSRCERSFSLRSFLAVRSTERTFSFPDLGHTRSSKRARWFPMRDTSRRLAWHVFVLRRLHARGGWLDLATWPPRSEPDVVSHPGFHSLRLARRCAAPVSLGGARHGRDVVVRLLPQTSFVGTSPRKHRPREPHCRAGARQSHVTE